MKRPYFPYCFRNKHDGPCPEDCLALEGLERERERTQTSKLILGSRDAPSVQEVDKRRSKLALRNGQGQQERIQQGFLEMTLVLGLKDE